MRRIFGVRLAGTEAQVGLVERAGLETICLLCLEADPPQYHRTLVAEAVAAESGIAISHLHPV